MEKQVFAFVDHTNIQISATKKAGRDLQFLEGVNDINLKVSPRKIFDYLQKLHSRKGKKLEQLICYTSDKNLSNHKNVGGQNIIVKSFSKSTWTNGEKMVDAYFVADAVETVFTKCPGIISLWSGDRDILTPVTEKAKNNGWKVEMWSFRASSCVTADAFPDVKIYWLDDEKVYSELTERDAKSKSNPEQKPKASFKLMFNLGSRELEIAKLKFCDIEKLLSKLLKFPLQCWFKWGEGFMYLILSVPKEVLQPAMGSVVENKLALETEVKNFMRWEHGLGSAQCSIVVDALGHCVAGNFPPAPLLGQFQDLRLQAQGSNLGRGLPRPAGFPRGNRGRGGRNAN